MTQNFESKIVLDNDSKLNYIGTRQRIDFSLQKTDGSDWTDLVLEIAHLDPEVTGQKGAFNFYGESNQSENISVQRFIGTTQYAAGDASMLPKVVVTSDAEDIAYQSSSFVAGKRSRREAGRIRIYLL